MNMKDMGIVFGSAEHAVPLVIGKDTVYVHSDIQQILEDKDGKPVTNLFQYHEIQYDKDEFIALLKNENDSLGSQLFDTQTQLLQTQADKDSLGQQLFDLQTQLVMKGVI